MHFNFSSSSLHTHTYHSTIFIVHSALPRSNRDAICTLTLSFPIHVTFSTNLYRLLAISRSNKDTFLHFFNLSFSSLYTLHALHSPRFNDLYRLPPLFRSRWIPNKLSNGKGWKTSVASNPKERRSSFRVRLALVGTQFLEIIRSSKEVGRSFLGSRFKLVPRGELTSRHNLESFVDRGVSRHR